MFSGCSCRSWLLFRNSLSPILINSLSSHQLFLCGVAVGLQLGNTQCVLLRSLAGTEEEAYSANVVDLLAVACNAAVLAAEQKCSQCLELVKCVTCQGSLLGFLYRGLMNKSYILRARPWVALTKEELNTFIYCPRAFILILFISERNWQVDWWSVSLHPCVRMYDFGLCSFAMDLLNLI